MGKVDNKEIVLLAACMLLAAWLRFDGLTRGTSDFLLPEHAGADVEEVFYNFHPDEETLVRAALRLNDPLEPPLTAYGLLPMYLVRAVLEVACWGTGREGLDVNSLADRPFIFAVVRATSALLSWASVWLVWGLGRRFFSAPAALLAAYFTAVAPVAVQQAHFYTVDGVFTFCAVAFFCAALPALATSHRGLYLLAGALVGAAGAVRLNGLLLGAVLAVGHVLVAEGPRRWRSLRRPQLWLAGAAAALVLIALQPYLVAEPTLLGRSMGTDDFAYSVEIARGEVLRPWSLVDVHTLPYLHYWTHLWPQGIGWPLTLVFGAALVYGVWQKHWVGRILLVWVALAFVPVGGLHTKHVRYLLPLLPFLSLVGADMLWRLAQRWRAGYAVLAAVALCAGVYGLAFASIYSTEDSRIQAGRWMADHVPEGSVIGVESGGFSLRGVISPARHRQSIIPVSIFFFMRGHILCEATRRHLYSQLQDLDYIAIAGVNRHQQFTAVPEMYPAVADFYKKLVAGELGFVLKRRFATYPSLGEWVIDDYGAEPSFVGYDHPAVWVFEKTDDFAPAWERWSRELAQNRRCGDAAAAAAAAHVGAKDWPAALGKAMAARQADPNLRFLFFLEAHIYGLQGNAERRGEALAQFRQGMADPSLSAYLLPWATCLSLMQLGLDDLALDALEESTRIAFPDQYIHRMAENSLHVADLYLNRGDVARTEAVYRISMRVEPQAKVATALGNIAHEDGRGEEALEWWEQSLQLDDGQLELRKRTGQRAFELGHYARGLDNFGRAVQEDPHLTVEQRVRDFNILARTALQARLNDRARTFLKQSLHLNNAQVEVRRQLEQLEANGKDRW